MRNISVRYFTTIAAFQAVAKRLGDEEIQHGQALARWASLADPTYDFAAAAARFTAGFRVDLDPAASVRGSRVGEMIARCVVETGTSSYYTALAEASREPVLRDICQRIAADEFRHYKLFYGTLETLLGGGKARSLGSVAHRRRAHRRDRRRRTRLCLLRGEREHGALRPQALQQGPYARPRLCRLPAAPYRARNRHGVQGGRAEAERACQPVGDAHGLVADPVAVARLSRNAA